MTKPKRIDLTPEELDALLERVESDNLQDSDYELIKGMAETIAYLSHVADQKGVQVARLLRALFGSSTEKRSAVLGESKEQQDPPAPSNPASAPDGEEKKRSGHGRRGAEEYTGAETVDVEHAELKPGDDCPKCEDGTLYKQSPGVVVRVKSSAPFEATVYKLQKLRCGLCGAIFTAGAPAGVGSQKYDESVSSLIAPAEVRHRHAVLPLGETPGESWRAASELDAVGPFGGRKEESRARLR
jgi:transposase